MDQGRLQAPGKLQVCYSDLVLTCARMGNKMPPGGGDSKDSTMGKLMEKAGGVMKNEGLVEKGHGKRAAKGAFEE